MCVLRWKDKSLKGRASRLEIVDEFRSFVKPTWRPQLSQFCTDLTGITQVRFLLLQLSRSHHRSCVGASRIRSNVSQGPQDVCKILGPTWAD